MSMLLPETIRSGAVEPMSANEALTQLRELVEAGRGRDAQKRAAAWAKQFPASRDLARWDDVLNTTSSSTGPSTWRDHRADDAWIKENAHRYPGNWMALSGGKLLALDPELTIVQDRVAELGVPRKDVLLWCQPRDPVR